MLKWRKTFVKIFKKIWSWPWKKNKKKTVNALTKVDNFSKDTENVFFFCKNTESLCDSVSDSPLLELSSVLTKSSRNIYCNTALFHIHFHWSISLVVVRTFVRFSKLPLPLVWKRFCWFIPSFSFLTCVRFFYIFLLSLIANNVCWT